MWQGANIVSTLDQWHEFIRLWDLQIHAIGRESRQYLLKHASGAELLKHARYYTLYLQGTSQITVYMC